jgi:hypothetical protein
MESVLTRSILQKWRNQAVFYRFLDGDKKNCAAKNLKAVSLKEALVHINDWVCDWDMELTDAEIFLVNNSIWRCGIIGSL